MRVLSESARADESMLDSGLAGKDLSSHPARIGILSERSVSKDLSEGLTPLEAHSYQSTSNCTNTGRPKSFRNTSLQTVRIYVIPRHLAALCFHILAHSFASLKMPTPLFSSIPALFAKNTGDGGSVPLGCTSTGTCFQASTTIFRLARLFDP